MSTILDKVLNYEEAKAPTTSLEAISDELENLLTNIREISNENMVVSTEGLIDIAKRVYKKIIDLIRAAVNLIAKIFSFERATKKTNEAEMKHQREEASKIDEVNHVYSEKEIHRIMKFLSIRNHDLVFVNDHLTSQEMIAILSKQTHAILDQTKKDFDFVTKISSVIYEETNYFMGLDKSSSSFDIGNTIKNGDAEWNETFKKVQEVVHRSEYFAKLNKKEFYDASPTGLMTAIYAQFELLYRPAVLAAEAKQVSVNDSSPESHYVDARAALISNINQTKESLMTGSFDQLKRSLERKAEKLEKVQKDFEDLLKKNKELSPYARANFIAMRREVQNTTSLIVATVRLGKFLNARLDMVTTTLTDMGKTYKSGSKKSKKR